MTHPEVDAWRLRQELRALRGPRTAATIAEALGWSESRVSRLETTGSKPRASTVSALLDHYQAPPDVRARIMDLVVGARQPDRWADCEPFMPQGSLTYVAFELVSQSLRACAPHSVPSVLQTAAYAAAQHRTFASITDEQAARCAEIHQHRQDRFDNTGQPHVWALLDESVLHRAVGSPDVMREQAQRLLDLAGRPNVNLQVLPFHRGLHAGTTPFCVFDTALNIGLEVVCAGLPTGLEFIRDEKVLAYRNLFERLIGSALPVAQSADLIEKLLSSPTWPA